MFLFCFSILQPFVYTFRESWRRCRSTRIFWISIFQIFWNCNFKISFSNLSNYIYQIRNSWYTFLIFNIRLGVYIRLSMCGLFTSVSPCLGSSVLGPLEPSSVTNPRASGEFKVRSHEFEVSTSNLISRKSSPSNPIVVSKSNGISWYSIHPTKWIIFFQDQNASKYFNSVNVKLCPAFIRFPKPEADFLNPFPRPSRSLMSVLPLQPRVSNVFTVWDASSREWFILLLLPSPPGSLIITVKASPQAE